MNKKSKYRKIIQIKKIIMLHFPLISFVPLKKDNETKYSHLNKTKK